MTDQKDDLVNYVIALGDDSLILGQRLSEWCYHAPFLEEDLALANVALDFIGRAQMFYDYASQLEERMLAAPMKLPFYATPVTTAICSLWSSRLGTLPSPWRGNLWSMPIIISIFSS